jgi:hypothetical protein
VGRNAFVGTEGDYIQVAFKASTYVGAIVFQPIEQDNAEPELNGQIHKASFDVSSVQIAYATTYTYVESTSPTYITDAKTRQDETFSFMKQSSGSLGNADVFDVYCTGRTFCPLSTSDSNGGAIRNSTIYPSIVANAIRIYIVKCNGACALKFELYGAKTPASYTVASNGEIVPPSVATASSSSQIDIQWGQIAVALSGVFVGLFLVVCISMYCFLERCRDCVSQKYRDIQDSLETDETEDTQEEGATN